MALRVYMYSIGITDVNCSCNKFPLLLVSLNNLQVSENLFERLEELKDMI